MVLDVDGVLTDGRLYFAEAGEVTKAFHVHDGTAIKNALYALEGFTGVTGTISFDEYGEVAKPFYMYTVAGGEFKLATPQRGG
ncbi:MAG: hypothetical protein IIA66_02725 [Planctomycetes bacterium]|nr:hypothetical protein [Planctomycetota bacterium]